jgi:uncharacterized RDD family membrane protein YckC
MEIISGGAAESDALAEAFLESAADEGSAPHAAGGPARSELELEPEPEPELELELEPESAEPEAAGEVSPGPLPADAGVDGPLPSVALTRRFGAAVADLLLLALIFTLFLVAGGLALHPQAGAGLALLLALSVPYFLVLFVLCFGYFTLFHFLTGQTPGKMLFRIRVADGAGGELAFTQAFLRSAGGLASLLLAGFGYLIIPFDSRRRGWNDRFAGTCLVPAVREEDPA